MLGTQLVAGSGLGSRCLYPRSARRAVSGLRFANFRPDVTDHRVDPGQVRILASLGRPIVNPFAVYEDFQYSLPSGRKRDRGVGAKVPEKLIRQPRGGAQVLSRYAVGDLYLDFAFHNGTSQWVVSGVVIASIGKMGPKSICRRGLAVAGGERFGTGGSGKWFLWAGRSRAAEGARGHAGTKRDPASES